MLRMFNTNENFSIDSTKKQLTINDKITKKYSFDNIFSSDVSQVNNQLIFFLPI
jgi:hypothetical protein